MQHDQVLKKLTFDLLTPSRALYHPILGPKFGPIPNVKKYVFFPIPDKEFPIWQKKGCESPAIPRVKGGG